MLPPQALEDGVEWRSPSPEDADRIKSFHDYFDGVFTPQDRRAMTSCATVLAGECEKGDGEPDPRILTSFLVAASLHVDTALQVQMMRFEQTAAGWRPSQVDAGGPVVRTQQLRAAGVSELSVSDVEAVKRTYLSLRRALWQGAEHPFRRSAGTFYAMLVTEWVEVWVILAWAALEAIAATSKKRDVVSRLVGQYVTDSKKSEAEQALEDLCALRVQFVHSLQNERFPGAQQRDAAIEQGIRVTKLLLREALDDDELFQAGMDGGREPIELWKRRFPPRTGSRTD